MQNNEKILPIALQESQLTDKDIEVMLRIAHDKNANSGRYKRTPKHLPIKGSDPAGSGTRFEGA